MRRRNVTSDGRSFSRYNQFGSRPAMTRASRIPSRTVIVCQVVVTALLTLKGSSSAHPQEQQRFSVMPESVEVVEGADVFLSCVVEHQQGKAQWTKDGFALGFERDVPGYPRYTYAGDPDLGEHHLAISGVTLTEDGEYQCQVGPTDTSPPLWAAANVTVLLAPTGISLVGWGDGAVVEVTEGTTLTLECLVADARPAPSAAWYRAGRRLLSETQVDRVEASAVARRWSVRSQLEVTASAADDGRQFSCQALHPTLDGGDSPLAAFITLSVLHPPGPPVVTGYDPSEVLVAGERRTLSCKSSGGNPRPWVLWYRLERLLDDTSTTVRAQGDPEERRVVVVNDHELAVTPSEDRAVYDCRVSNDLLEFPLTTNVTLTVYYPPATVTVRGPSQVGVGQPFNLTCESSDSNPPASLTWTLQGKVVETSKSVVGREGSGGFVTSSSLTHYAVRSPNVTEVTVECRALNPAVEEVVTKVTTVTVIRPAGRPAFESDLRGEVIAGTSLDLTCLSVGGHPPPSVRVFKNGEELATEVLLEEAGLTRAKLALEVTPADNGAEVSCEVTNPASKTPLVTSATLSVLFPPWEVSGTVAPSTLEEGQIATLACVTSASRPASNITWRSQGASLEGAVFTTSKGGFGGASSRSELHLSTLAEDNGRSFVCEAFNGLGVTINTELVLNVLHSPVWLVQPPEQLDVYEGAQLVVTATAAANPGPLRYWWRRGESTLEATDGELRLGRVSRSHSGSYSVNAYNPRGAVNATFALNVQYGPEKVQSAERVTVGEGGAATVECSATANPSPTLTWTRSTHNSTAQTLSSGVGVARLVVDSATWADTGVYLCHASNIVSSSPPVQTKLVVTQAPTVAKEIAGASGTWAAIGGDGRLVCRVRAAPAPSFVWTTQEGLTIQNSEKYSLHDPQLVDGLVLWAAVLEVRQVCAEDYAHYTCNAHNALGSDSTDLALNPPARPHPPSNFTVTNVSSASVSVAWTPNFDGGLPRGYTIRYRPAGTLDYQFVDISGGNTAGTTLGGLTSGTEYFFSIQAKNDQGRSDYLSPPLLITLKGVGGRGNGEGSGGRRWRAPRLILLIMSLTGAALLVLNVAIIACFVRRRSRARRASGSSSTKPVALDTYCGTPDSTPGPHHSEGFLTLTTRASNNVSNSPSSYKEEQQTSIDRCEKPNTGSSSMIEIRPNITLLQNGTLARKNSTSSTQNGGVVNRTPSFNIQSTGSLRQNGGIPTQPQQGNRGSSPSVTPLNGRIPNQGKVHPQNNPEVCSLTSTCDSQHPHHHHQHQHHQRRDSGSLPADDQVSLSSYQSNHSRTYSQGYVRPLPPPGCPHHPPTRQQIQPLYQSHPYHQQQPEQQPRHHHHGPPTYSSLNPSGLYNLSSEYFDSRCNQSSFSTGTPAGYATLGPRSRRATPSQFATLQRPQPSRPHIQNHSQNPGHECSVLPRCQGDCCRPLQKNDEDERLSISACQVNHGTFEAEHHHPRRSSFHGPLRRESQRYDVVVPVPHSHLTHQQRQDNGAPRYITLNQNNLSPESDTAQPQNKESPGYSTAKYQESGSPGYSVPEQEDNRHPGCSIPQQQDNRLPEKTSVQQKDLGGNSIGPHSLSQPHNLSGGNTFTSQSSLAKQESVQNSSSSSPPHKRDSSLRREVSFKSNSSNKEAGTSGRPRFPHDYVRQGSTKGKSSSRAPREGGDASHGNR